MIIWETSLPGLAGVVCIDTGADNIPMFYAWKTDGENMRIAIYKGGVSEKNPSGATLVKDFGIIDKDVPIQELIDEYMRKNNKHSFKKKPNDKTASKRKEVK